jgi:ABC-type cobalt transport system substrate-binding protein
MHNKRLIIIFLTLLFLLLIPLIAMQFTDDVNWTTTDFIIAGGLLLGTGFITEIVLRTIKKHSYRVALLSVIFIIVILIWLELAVGIFGTLFSGN